MFGKKQSKRHISETKKEEAIILVHDTSACQNTYSYNIHVISPAFSGSSRFGASPPGPPLWRRFLPTRRFSNVVFSPTIFLSEHFIVYGNSISGESKVSGLYQSNLMTIDAC